MSLTDAFYGLLRKPAYHNQSFSGPASSFRDCNNWSSFDLTELEIHCGEQRFPPGSGPPDGV
jgi:hypothetical protein